VNLERAIDYIQVHGGVVEQARLGYALHKNRPDSAAIRSLMRSQRADGGWPPFWAADYSSLDATCFHLAQAEQMGLTANDVPVERACRFIARRQREDGSWEEDAAYALAAPAWARPGRRAARLYLTSNCAFWLAILVEKQRGVSLAAGYLRDHMDAKGALPSYLQTHWLAAGAWQRLNWSEAVEQALGYLFRRLIELPSSNMAWMILSLRLAGMPLEHPLINQALIYLEQYQREDGSWPGEDPSSGDVHATLEALRALRMCGRF
jgi:hypothetical protein